MARSIVGGPIIQRPGPFLYEESFGKTLYAWRIQITPLNVDELRAQAETERLLSLGAQRLRDVQRDKFRWTTFADIEGNEFDLVAG